MNDLGTGAEHTNTSYLWRANKRGQRVHIENSETERAYCQVENCGGKPFDGRGAEIPTGRRLCGNCTDLTGRNEVDYRESAVRVLMGERMADVEPELWEQKKQTRSAHRSKGRKPKRSNVKYPRPFNDDLPPWL